MDTGLKNKVVLITGATRNHGKATALAFAAEGANLLICTRKSMDLLEDTARLAADRGIKVLAKLFDDLAVSVSDGHRDWKKFKALG